MDTIASRLAAAMKAKGVKIPALVKVTGMTYQGIKKILDGKTASIHADNLFAMAAHLGVDPHWLATGEGEMLRPEAIDVPSRWVDEPQPERAALGMTTALPTLAQALDALASAFAHTPESTRNTVATLTASAVRDPATLPDCLRAIEALAAYSTATVETAAISKVGATIYSAMLW